MTPSDADAASARTPTRRLLSVVKIVLPVVIIGWLFSRIDAAQWIDLRDRPKDWPRLVSSFALILAAIVLTFVRWYLLVRAIELPFRLRDALRLGFLGCLFGLVTVGHTGGDLFKAIFIAREQPRRRAEAAATVVLDRLVGLFGLCVVVCLALATSPTAAARPTVLAIGQVAFVAAVAFAVAGSVALLPGFTTSPLAEWLTGLPRAGDVLGRMFAAIRLYRARPGTLFIVLAISLAVHALLVMAVFNAAQATYPVVPTLTEHFVIVPAAGVVGALPFMPAGFGQYELAMDKLYALVPRNAAAITPGMGLLMAFVYRLATIAAATIGAAYYSLGRSQVRTLLQEANQAEPCSVP